MSKNNIPEHIGNIIKNITRKSVVDNAAKEKDNAYDISKIFQQMELDLISSMHRALAFHKREESKEGFKWEQWQLSKLRAMEEYRKRNKAIVDSYSKPIQKAIDSELGGNFNKGIKRVQKIINRIKNKIIPPKKASTALPSDTAGKEMIKEYIAKTLNRPYVPAQEQSFFGVNEKKLEALQDTVKHDIQEAQYSVLRKMDDVYRQTLFKTHMYLQNGTKTLDQAIDMATKDFLDKGIDSVVYKNGAKVNVASYAEMCLRTASQRATFLGEGTKRDEWGLHLVVVSAHGNTCEMCEPWPGKKLIDDVFSHPSKEYLEENSKYPLLSEAIKAGLLHPNCRHSLITYFPGITQLPTVPDGKEAIKTYEAEQQQRALERQIRKWKRIVAGSVDAENASKAMDKVKELENRLKQHLKDNPQLRRDYNREEPKPGITNSQVKATAKLLKEQAESVKIKEINEPLPSRHRINSIGKKSIPKDKNTVILNHVDVSKDISDIKNGLYKKEGEYYTVNGRKYGIHNSRFYPVEGDGFVSLDRNEYKALIKLKTEKDNPMIDKILSNMKVPDETIKKLKDLLGGE